MTITSFEDDHRIALASHLYVTAGLDANTARGKAQTLNRQLQQIDAELKDRPMFVTLMATDGMTCQRSISGSAYKTRAIPS